MPEWLTPPVRRWIYGICAALAALAIGLTWIDEKTAGLVLALISAIIAPGLALPNVRDDDPPPYMPQHEGRTGSLEYPYTPPPGDTP